MSDVSVRVSSRLVTLEGERASVAVSVTNAAARPQRVVLGTYESPHETAGAAAAGAAAQLAAAQLAAATTIERPVRELPPGATEQYVATIHRDGAATGEYGLTFIAHPVDRAPEEYGDHAQVVQVVVPVDGTAPPPTRRWWLLALFVGLVVVAGAIVLVLTRPSSVIVPGVVGQSSLEAGASLRAAGLDMVVVTERGPEPLDTVIRQEPTEGAEVREGSEVLVVVQVGVVLPDVVGLDVDDAAAALGKDVLVQPVPEESDQPAGTVLRMEPPGGTEVGAGSAVRLAVAGERTVAVPSVTGRQAEGAAAVLTSAGLRARVVRGSLCRLPTAPVCTVLRQDPAAGSRVPLGATVLLTTP